MEAPSVRVNWIARDGLKLAASVFFADIMSDQFQSVCVYC